MNTQNNRKTRKVDANGEKVNDLPEKKLETSDKNILEKNTILQNESFINFNDWPEDRKQKMDKNSKYE